MGGTWTAAIGLVTGAALSLGAASAQEMIDGANPDLIVEILKGFGIARLETANSSGNPKISGRTEGKAYEVFFYGCDDAKANCNSIQFWAYWDQDSPLETINGWNKDTRYGKVYIDQDGDVVLEYDVNLRGGISAETLEDNAVIWVQLLSRVEEDVVGE